jgi:opacity protein-like surface antigen
VNFGSQVENGRGGFGVNAGGMGAGIIGAEAAFGFNPSFFGSDNDFGTNTVLDLMGNVIVGIPIGGRYGPGFRPYVTGGLGLIRTQVDGGDVFTPEFSDNDFGWNAGVGVMGFFNDHVGLRGDLRYFRTINSEFPDSFDFDDGEFRYWRGAIGIVIR